MAWTGYGSAHNAKRRKGPMVEISRALSGVLDGSGLGHLIYEEMLRKNWVSLLGPRAAAMASLESLKGFVLRLKVESSTWRMELSYQRDAIRRKANDILGAELIKDVVLL